MSFRYVGARSVPSQCHIPDPNATYRTRTPHTGPGARSTRAASARTPFRVRRNWFPCLRVSPVLRVNRRPEAGGYNQAVWRARRNVERAEQATIVSQRAGMVGWRARTVRKSGTQKRSEEPNWIRKTVSVRWRPRRSAWRIYTADSKSALTPRMRMSGRAVSPKRRRKASSPAGRKPARSVCPPRRRTNPKPPA